MIEETVVRVKKQEVRARCIGCGARFKTKTSRYGVCAECNPVRYRLVEGDLLPTLDGSGEFKMSSPFPGLQQPAALAVIGKRTYVVLPYDLKVATWWLAPFTTYTSGVVQKEGEDFIAFPEVHPFKKVFLFFRRFRWAFSSRS